MGWLNPGVELGKLMFNYLRVCCFGLYSLSYGIVWLSSAACIWPLITCPCLLNLTSYIWLYKRLVIRPNFCVLLYMSAVHS